jgi:hypothetical protein
MAGDSDTPKRTATATKFWSGVNVEPVEIALNSGVGYTLRAYRMDNEITPADVSMREDDVDLPTRASVYDDEDEDFSDAVDAEFDEAEADDEEPADETDSADSDGSEGDETDEEEEEEEEAEPVVEPEEVPLFLTKNGHLLLFRSAQGLVDYVKSGDDNDLAQIDTWKKLVADIKVGYVVPLPDDEYELDLVVKNLRGGRDSWDPELIVQSGQVARDLSHALKIAPVIAAMAPGSPLDDLDEALRGSVSGGFGGFMARRKLKRIGEQAATLGWRTIIGKIQAVVDWRD